jgi:hypothetical protein
LPYVRRHLAHVLILSDRKVPVLHLALVLRRPTRVTDHELLLDRAEIHWVLDHVDVVRDVECDGINGLQEGERLLLLFHRADDAEEVFVLGEGERDGGAAWAGRSGDVVGGDCRDW